MALPQPINIGAERRRRAPAVPRPFGHVKSRKGRIAITFRYFGVTDERRLGWPDTPANRKKARKVLDAVQEKIDAGEFEYAKAFPAAPEKRREFFTRLEGGDLRKAPEEVLFREYTTGWTEKNLAEDVEPSESRRTNYSCMIRKHLLPQFRHLTFAEIRGTTIADFLRERRHLSPKTLRYLLVPLRAIWDDAVEEHDWDLRNPFEHVRRKNKRGQLIPRIKSEAPEVFGYDEWMAILAHMDPWYRPVCDVMVMTGMIASELQRLCAEDIEGEELVVRGTKTAHRFRRLPITQPLRQQLDTLLRRTSGHLVTTHRERPFEKSRFRERYWVPALHAAGVRYRRPYATRHTFVAWGLRTGIHPDDMAQLAGHGSRRMVYEVYGLVSRGLAEDAARISAYSGWEKPKENPLPGPPARVFRGSIGGSMGSNRGLQNG